MNFQLHSLLKGYSNTCIDVGSIGKGGGGFVPRRGVGITWYAISHGIQWNLSTTDKLGIGPLSLVERLSPSQRLSLYHYCITK